MSRIYSATYSNVPVYEYTIENNHVMRRRADDWINATHILKVAEYDKPTRTRILEREVQKGTHEKVQGGYGKYQGTWIPLPDGRMLAERNGVLPKLLPIFDFIPGDQSPPPAPKHATAVSKPKTARQAAARQAPGRKTKILYTPQCADNLTPRVVPQPRMIDDSMEIRNYQMQEETPSRASMMMSEEDEDRMNGSQYSNRKRKRGVAEPPQMSYAEQQHLLWTDELLDYFMLQSSNDPLPPPPEAPATIDLNRAVDEKGHTPMHWAAAMGDLQVVNDLIRRNARMEAQSHNGETPLMRAVMFTNNWDKQTMDGLVHTLNSTIPMTDWFGSTVFHHIAATTCSKSKYACARYYLDTILTKLSELWPAEDIAKLLDQPDHNGDTAIILAARYGARKCVRALLNHGVNIDHPNQRGETADELIKELNARRRDRYRQTSSSPPPQANGTPTNIRSSPTIQPATMTPRPHHRDSAGPAYYRSEAATMLASQLPTLITSRAEALAAALEAELAEREAEAQEAERLVSQRRQEMEQLQRQSQALCSRVGDVNLDDAAFDESQQNELEGLMQEAERLFELEQITELEQLIQEEEAKAGPDVSNNDITEKIQLAYALQAQQAKRRKLVSEVVAAQSLAGTGITAANGERHNGYKRLISGALNVPSEEIEAILPEILRDLEEAAAQGPSADAGGFEGHAEVMMNVDGTPRLGGGHGFGPLAGGGRRDGGLASAAAGEPVGVMG